MPAHIHLHPATPSHDTTVPFRRHPRTLFSVPIMVRHLSRGGVRTVRGISLDLGEGGLGAIVEGDVHVGDTVAIDLRLTGQSLTTVAIVRHASIVRSGFEFVGLTPEERVQITSVIGHS
jgi:hypothetical protein